jgi:hypothetical protein
MTVQLSSCGIAALQADEQSEGVASQLVTFASGVCRSRAVDNAACQMLNMICGLVYKLTSDTAPSPILASDNEYQRVIDACYADV